MHNYTIFDPDQKYIILPIFVSDKNGEEHLLKAILDTGAPTTEFSDEALEFLGFLDRTKHDVELKRGLQTQKYGRITISHMDICSHHIDNLEVFVSHFEKSWGIDALIGLDFFRKFRTTIDYKKGAVITEIFQSEAP